MPCRCFTALDDGSKKVVSDDVSTISIPAAAAPANIAGPLLQCRALRFGWSSAEPLSQAFDLDVSLTSRVGILGANGTGKSTFLKTLAGEIPALAGEVYQSSRIKVQYFSQHVADNFNLALCPVEILHEAFPDATEQEIRGHLGSFGVRTQALVVLAHLSGGEKTRVALAVITFEPPHILLMDEPTNHLDINTVTAITDGLKQFSGGLVVVSHDRRLIEALELDCYMLSSKTRVWSRTTLKRFLAHVKPK